MRCAVCRKKAVGFVDMPDESDDVGRRMRIYYCRKHIAQSLDPSDRKIYLNMSDKEYDNFKERDVFEEACDKDFLNFKNIFGAKLI